MQKGILILILSLLILPSFAFAFTTPNVWDPSILKGPLVTCTGNGGASPNGGNTQACQSLCDLIYTFINVIYFAIALVLWILAPIFFGVSGIMFLLSGASPELRSTAKKSLTGTVWGIIIVLCSWLIVNTIVTFFGITGIGGFGASICQ